MTQALVVRIALALAFGLIGWHPDSIGATLAFIAVVMFAVADEYLTFKNQTSNQKMTQETEDRLKKIEGQIESLTLGRVFNR